MELLLKRLEKSPVRLPEKPGSAFLLSLSLGLM